jgi:uncharacterized protein
MKQKLLGALTCPVTRTALRWDEQRQELVSEAAGVAYPVRDGIPVMLVEHSRPLSSSPGSPKEGDQEEPGDGALRIP